MVNPIAEVSIYVLAALIILGTVYSISAFGSYIQGRINNKWFTTTPNVHFSSTFSWIPEAK